MFKNLKVFSYYLMVFSISVFAEEAKDEAPKQIIPKYKEYYFNQGPDEPQNVVLNSKKDFEESLHPNIRDFVNKRIGRIDLKKQTAVLIAMGTQKSGGFKIVIDKVIELGDTVNIEYHFEAPKPGAPVTLALTTPFHLLIFEKKFNNVELTTSAAAK
ncbi:MAG: protease complex subunit PrcB family protein [Lentisphaeria bacterium]|nr:protease complex subunit PrcB family protein [Lentisphaeria bacterium]